MFGDSYVIPKRLLGRFRLGSAISPQQGAFIMLNFMKKKEAKKEEPVVTSTFTQPIEIKTPFVEKLDLNLGRHDLNLLVEKINEIISVLNSK